MLPLSLSKLKAVVVMVPVILIISVIYSALSLILLDVPTRFPSFLIGYLIFLAAILFLGLTAEMKHTRLDLLSLSSGRQVATILMVFYGLFIMYYYLGIFSSHQPINLSLYFSFTIVNSYLLSTFYSLIYWTLTGKGIMVDEKTSISWKLSRLKSRFHK